MCPYMYPVNCHGKKKEGSDGPSYGLGAPDCPNRLRIRRRDGRIDHISPCLVDNRRCPHERRDKGGHDDGDDMGEVHRSVVIVNGSKKHRSGAEARRFAGRAAATYRGMFVIDVIDLTFKELVKATAAVRPGRLLVRCTPSSPLGRDDDCKTVR